jgi:hypothetical protein
MQFLSRHILTIGRLFLLLFFLGNSGFTVVLYHCTMEDMDCCSASDEKMSCACSMMEPIQSSGGPAVSSGDNCHSMTIAGSLKTDLTVLEKESVTRVIKLDLVAAVTPKVTLSTVPSQGQLFSSTGSQNASPAAVETYVLNSTFRI